MKMGCYCPNSVLRALAWVWTEDILLVVQSIRSVPLCTYSRKSAIIRARDLKFSLKILEKNLENILEFSLKDIKNAENTKKGNNTKMQKNVNMQKT